MNEAIKNLSFNLNIDEVKTLLGEPLLTTNKQDVVILVYSSLVDKKSDVLYFAGDQLKVKSLSNFGNQEIPKNVSTKEGELYLLQADNRGTANEQWLRFYGNDGFALISENKIGQGPVDRIIYFEQMDIGEFTRIWGGSKFIRSSEQVVSVLATQSANQEPVAIAPASNWRLPIFVAIGVVVLLITLIILLWIKKKRTKVVPTALPPTQSTLPENQV